MDRGISYPFERGDQGYFKQKSGVALMRGNIAQIIGTIPGERVMEPEFGSLLRTLIFEHIDEPTLTLAKTYVIDAIERWEKRVTLLRAQVIGIPDEGSIAVRMTYRYDETGAEDTYTVIVDQNGGVKWQQV